MSEEITEKHHSSNSSTSSETWENIGHQFKEIGESLATAFRTAWHNDENRQRMQKMQAGLESMANEVSKAINEGVNTSEMEYVRNEAKKAAQFFHSTGEQAFHEVRPHLLSALRQVNEELHKLICQMEQDESIDEVD